MHLPRILGAGARLSRDFELPTMELERRYSRFDNNVNRHRQREVSFK